MPDALLNIASAQSELGDNARRAAHARGADRQVPAVRGGGQGEAAARALGDHAASDSVGQRRRRPATFAAFARALVAWQRAHGRHDLPWQGTRDPYRIWLSEIMLQQTQVATVLPYYDALRRALSRRRARSRGADRRACSRTGAASATTARAHTCTRPRTRSSSGTAACFRATSATLAALPGIGRSTAAAIAAFAYGERARDPRRQREARARAPSRHRGLSRRSRASSALWAMPNAAAATRHRGATRRA